MPYIEDEVTGDVTWVEPDREAQYYYEPQVVQQPDWYHTRQEENEDEGGTLGGGAFGNAQEPSQPPMPLPVNLPIPTKPPVILPPGTAKLLTANQLPIPIDLVPKFNVGQQFMPIFQGIMPVALTGDWANRRFICFDYVRGVWWAVDEIYVLNYAGRHRFACFDKLDGGWYPSNKIIMPYMR